jgi:hypothetical protein
MARPAEQHWRGIRTRRGASRVYRTRKPGHAVLGRLPRAPVFHRGLGIALVREVAWPFSGRPDNLRDGLTAFVEVDTGDRLALGEAMPLLASYRQALDARLQRLREEAGRTILWAHFLWEDLLTEGGYYHSKGAGVVSRPGLDVLICDRLD